MRSVRSARRCLSSCLACLTKKRLISLAGEFAVELAQVEPKAAFVEALAHSKAASFAKVLEAIPVAELRLVCRSHELPTSGAKSALFARIRRDDEGDAAQTSLLASVADAGSGEEALAAVFARAQPSIAGLVPLLTQRELATVLRRLDEHHGISLDLTSIAGLDGLSAALAGACELSTALGGTRHQGRSGYSFGEPLNQV